MVNYALPESDYRVQYPRLRPGVHALFGTPVQPPGVPDEDYVPLAFGEGVAARDALTFVQLWLALWRRRRTLDVVHFFSTKLVLLGPLVAAAARVPAIVTVTGFGRVFNDEGHRVARVVYRLLLRVAARLSRLVLFQNRGDMEQALQWMPSLAPKAFYVGSATTAVEPVEHDFDRPRLRVLHVARLLPSKGVPDFVQVAEALADEPVDFVLAGGPSDDYPDVARLVASSTAVRHTGRLASEQLAAEYDAADILFFPSYGEGMARVMLEAGMRGLAAVGYDIAANRDLAGAVLVPIGDVDAAAKAIAQLVEDRAALRAAAASFEAHVRAEFSMERFAQRLDEVLARL